MIDNAVVRAVEEVDAILFAAAHIAEPTAQVAHNHIVSLDADAIVAQAYAIARRALAGDGEKRAGDDDRFLERDRAAHAKDHGARTIRLARRAQAARAGVVKVGHEERLAAAAAGGVGAETFGTGEGGECGRAGASGTSDPCDEDS